MARSFDDKKKEIFNYLSKYASKNNFLELTEDKLFNKFRGIIKEEEIKEIISKLEEEGSLNRNNLNYDIIYPKDNEDKILRMFSNKIKRDILWIYIIITFIWMYFINNFQIIPDFILERMVGEGEKTNGQIFNIGFLVSLFVIFFISKVLYKGYSRLKEVIPFLKDYRNSMNIFVAIISIIIITFFAQIKYPEYQFIATAITSIIAIIITWSISNKE